MKKIIFFAFGLHIFLSNFCMMPMASAMDAMEMHHDMQQMEEVPEIVMTPANAMSPLHCDACVTISRPRGHASDMGPCSDGHCLAEHTPTLTAVTQSPLKEAVKIAALPSSFSYTEPIIDSVHLRLRERPPIQGAFLHTIVLRE